MLRFSKFEIYKVNKQYLETTQKGSFDYIPYAPEITGSQETLTGSKQKLPFQILTLLAPWYFLLACHTELKFRDKAF